MNSIDMHIAFQGIMLVYDITQEKTFENISKWLRNIEEVGEIKLMWVGIVVKHLPLTNVVLGSIASSGTVSE
jgi:hypothetical protein